MKYVSIHKPVKAEDDWEFRAPVVNAVIVHESEDLPIETGLLDSSGVKLYRVKEPKKIGYL